MADWSASYDILANVRGERDVAKLGDSFDLAAAGAKVLKESLEKTSKAAGVSADASLALAKSDKILADAEEELSGRALLADEALRAEARAKRDAADAGDALKTSSLGAAFGLTSLASPMGALLGAGAALAPVAITLGVGMAGFGAAAAGAIAPVMKASSAAGGLAANFHKLNPEQQQVALSLMALKADFADFQKQLAPTVLLDFSKGMAVARTVMREAEPVSAAFGKSLGTLLDSVGTELKSGTWQQFFGWMARTVRPDMAQLTSVVVDTTHAIPPLVETLQPLAAGLLDVVDSAAKDIGALGNLTAKIAGLGGTIKTSNGDISFMTGVVHTLLHPFEAWGGAVDLVVPKIKVLTSDVVAANMKIPPLTQNVAQLTGGLRQLSAGLLTTQGDQVAWRNALAQANTTLKQNSGDLSLNTQRGRDDRTAILGATNAALIFAAQQMKTGGNTVAASRTLQAQISWLQIHGGKARWAADQIAALRTELHKLQQTQFINEIIRVTGTGNWRATAELPGQPGMHFVGRVAAGGLIPGTGNTDSYPALLTPGETVFPKHLTPAVAPLARAFGLPGFARGGLVGDPWTLRSWTNAEVTASQMAIASAMTAALAKAFATGGMAAMMAGAGGGGLGGNAQANRALGRAMMLGMWGPGQWNALDALWTRESGWSNLAYNAASGATGIPQALPYSKMPRAAWLPFQGGQASPGAQIGWGLGYIAGRYGSPGGAWGHELAVGWYDKGGYLPPGLSLALNTTGRPEGPVGGGNTYNVTVNAPFLMGATKAEMENALTAALERLAKQGRLP